MSLLVPHIVWGKLLQPIRLSRGIAVAGDYVPCDPPFCCVVKSRVSTRKNIRLTKWLNHHISRARGNGSQIYLTFMYDVEPVTPKDTDFVTDAIADTKTIGS